MNIRFIANQSRRGHRAAVAAALIGTVAWSVASVSSTSAASKNVVSAANLAKAKAAVAAARHAPTSIGITVPLKQKPKRGGLVSLIYTSSNPSASYIYHAMAQAGVYLGFKSKFFDEGTTNDQLYTAFADANTVFQQYRKKGLPVGVWVGALPRPEWAKWYNLWYSEGIPIMVESSPGFVSINDKVMDDATSSQDAKVESVLGDWAVADANGAAANTLVVGICPNVGSFCEADRAIGATIRSLCSACQTHLLEIPLTDVGTTLPTDVVSFFQKNPQYKYLIFDMAQGVSTAVYSALKVAGLTNIRVGTAIGGTADLAALKSGQDQINQSWSSSMQGFLAVDFFARSLAHQPDPQDGNWEFPNWLQKSSDITNVNTLLDYPSNWKAQFLKLWGVK